MDKHEIALEAGISAPIGHLPGDHVELPAEAAKPPTPSAPHASKALLYLIYAGITILVVEILLVLIELALVPAAPEP